MALNDAPRPKIFVVGLDCAAPELLLGMDDLPHLRHLMSIGAYGRLESVIPPITVPAWMCMATSQDPGTLGIYGFRNRADHSYAALATTTSASIRALAIWDQVAREGGRSTIIGVPPSFPPRRINGTCVGCFLTPDTTTTRYTHPASAQEEIARVVADYPVDVAEFRTDRKAWLLDEIHRMTRAHFAVVRHFVAKRDWDYFHFVEIGLDRIHHGFWQYHDPDHVAHDPTSPFTHAIRDYYRTLDRELGELLALLDPDTIVLVVSDHGAQRLDGGFAINQWLIDEGLLVLARPPTGVTPFAKLDVDWAKTRAWSEGGYYARVFLNVRGREPSGPIAPEDYEPFRRELADRLERIRLPSGAAMGNRAHRPEDLYRTVNGIAPDLIAILGGLYWRSIGSVGHGALFVQENDSGPDGCNHAQHGAFVLAGASLAARGELEGIRLIDIAPTLLDLAGYDVPDAMQGRSFARDAPRREDGLTQSEERVIEDRLSGLGYIQ